MNTIYIPNGGCELVSTNGQQEENSIKINRQLLITNNDKEPKKHEMVKVFMPNGFMYNGQIYLKTRTYAYLYLY